MPRIVTPYSIGNRYIIQGEPRYQLIKLTLDSGESIETTAEHPFYIKGKGWNPASSLKVGEVLQLHNGTTVVIKQIDTTVRVEKVYNLTVANTHNYFVGVDGVLVHNCSLKNASGNVDEAARTARTKPHDTNTITKRRVAKNLHEQLALEEAQGGAGKVIINSLNDPRYKGWQKIEHVHRGQDGSKIVVHYIRDPKTGTTTDFKFK